MTDSSIMHPAEQLFLDISIHDVLTKRLPFVEPWATMYVDSIREQRYGDAIWARSLIFGGTEDGVITEEWPNPDITVLDNLRENAVEAKTNEPGFYARALEFYAKTNSTDGHPEVIKIIFETDGVKPGEREAEEDVDEEEEGEESEEGEDGEQAEVGELGELNDLDDLEVLDDPEKDGNCCAHNQSTNKP
ncbi:hypothetical protein NW762_013450 [Fusarium torreyae]|uniref:Uncharacterized protein n=1 Tax=Fusarium torreyae TaxID=1237075 RepID=A0A9W8VA87_9HYPO|nr:hypothetical protein NW762_013450 [Fusarium torreyae]